MARQLLTKKRAGWVANRSVTMRGAPLAFPAAVASRYAATLQRKATEMSAETSRRFVALFKHGDVQDYFATFHHTPNAPTGAMDISPASQARILGNALRSKWGLIFGGMARDLALQTVTGANDASASAVYSSLKDLSGGLSLKTDFLTGNMEEVLKAAIAQNVQLIRSIPQQYFGDVQGAVLRSITTGRGLADLVPYFETAEGEVSRRSKNIAFDQTHKAYNGFNRGRMQAVGVKAFEWVHSGGGLHPRQRHIDLSGRTFTFDKLPVIDDDGTRGIPGQAVNCRCTMVPVIKFEKGEPQ